MSNLFRTIPNPRCISRVAAADISAVSRADGRGRTSGNQQIAGGFPYSDSPQIWERAQLGGTFNVIYKWPPAARMPEAERRRATERLHNQTPSSTAA